MAAPALIDVFVNSGLEIAESRLTNPRMLNHGASCFENASGTVSERLEIAIVEMLRVSREPIDTFELPENLESMTKAQLVEFMDREGIIGVSEYATKDRIISRIRGEHSNRRHWKG